MRGNDKKIRSINQGGMRGKDKEILSINQGGMRGKGTIEARSKRGKS